MTQRIGFSFAAAAGLAAILLAADAPQASYTSWSDYGGALDSMQYSALKQVNKANVAKLELAWTYKVPDRRGNFGFNPIVANGKMYVLGANNAIVALDAVSGREIWSHASEQNIVSQRGIMYWSSKDGKDRRLIYGAGSYLYAINADTGAGISTFGDDGRIWENRIIVGSQTGEGDGSAPGDLRAFDVVSGKLLWTFHTIPHPGEFGYDTWPKDAWTFLGGVNTWGGHRCRDLRPARVGDVREEDVLGSSPRDARAGVLPSREPGEPRSASAARIQVEPVPDQVGEHDGGACARRRDSG